MGQIDKDRLKERIDVRQLAKDLGFNVRNNQTQCFNSSFHSNGDKNPSLGLKPSFYKCFACGEAGDAFSLYQQMTGADFKTSIYELAKQYAPDLIPVDYSPNSTTRKPQSLRSSSFNRKPLKSSTLQQKPQGKTQLKAIFSDIYQALAYYNLNAGKSDVNEEGREYLKTRGFASTYPFFSIDNYQEVNDYLKKSFSLEDLKGAGLFSSKGNLIFFKHNLIAAIQDLNGAIIYLQGRRLPSSDTPQKYLNLKTDPGPPVPLISFPFPDQEGNLLSVFDQLDKGDQVFLCEGIFDTLRLLDQGLPAVGIFGVNGFKEEFLPLFKGLEVVLCMDSDPAGDKATKTLGKLFFKAFGKIPQRVSLPPGMDIDEFLKDSEGEDPGPVKQF